MPRYFALKIFTRWLAQNSRRFNYPPRIYQRRKTGFKLEFRGISPLIYAYVGKCGNIGVGVLFHQELIDCLADFDVYEERTPEGVYFCKLCTEPDMYKSREELWIKHSFEPMLQWMNKKFTDSSWLYLSQTTGYSDAEIGGEEELSRAMESEGFLHACPVVLKRN